MTVRPSKTTVKEDKAQGRVNGTHPEGEVKAVKALQSQQPADGRVEVVPMVAG